MKNTIQLTKQYLLIPVSENGTDTKIEILCDGEKLHEMIITLDSENYDFYSSLLLKKYVGKKIEIVGEISEGWFDQVTQSDKKAKPKGIRPHLHYAPVSGWMNDPNGLIYYNGYYHMYHQHNPYGKKWNNIHWSHTMTKDFITYTETEPVLSPDVNGAMYSGTAICDSASIMGYGKDAILYYYTCAGSKNDWSEGKEFIQKIAYSIDEGKTLIKTDDFIMEHIVEENRDPKVFYHSDSEAYIMILYLSNDTFGIYRSIDLKNWIETDRLHEEGMWECPDLFEVTNPENKVKKWVFWSADGYYILGDFDGRVFTRETKRLSVYASLRKEIKNLELMRTYRAYAAQTFFGVGQRVLQLSWISSDKKERDYKGQFSLPAELRLCRTADGDRISLLPAVELNYLHKKQKCEKKQFNKDNPYKKGIHNNPFDIFIKIKKQNKGKLNLICLNNIITIDFTANKISTNLMETEIIEQGKYITLRIFVDIDIIEIFSQKGLSYFVLENISDNLIGYIETETKDNIEGTINYYECNSVKMVSNLE